MIIFAHGLGAAHKYYIPLMNSLAERGYLVFGFDNTGVGESEGESQNGLEQSILDLEAAIKFIKSRKEFSGLKISLVGHSLGGYAVATVLNEIEEISSVVILSGFSRTYDLERAELEGMAGTVGNLAETYLYLIENLKFGKYANYTGLDGLIKSKVSALIVASEDDEVVKPEFGFKLYKDKLPETQAEFILYQNRGHLPFYKNGLEGFINGGAIDEELVDKIDGFIERN
ncbi:alpha/beta fold hydrolase [Candidatus Saccharibacteria bacterium]|nr:alpha/beta fold hydrolase [Candidatus Saccharibacteria bacterium]